MDQEPPRREIFAEAFTNKDFGDCLGTLSSEFLYLPNFSAYYSTLPQIGRAILADRTNLAAMITVHRGNFDLTR